MESYKGLPSDRLQPCLQILKQGWKGMTVTNTLAYYDTVTITAVKSFIVQAPEANVTLFVSVIYALSKIS